MSYYFTMKGDTKHCNKCNHTWISRVDYEPITCPRCKNPDWTNEKVYEVKRTRRERDTNN